MATVNNKKQITPEQERDRIFKDWLANNRNEYELQIIGAVWWNWDFFQKVRGQLCKLENLWVDEFNVSGCYAVYRAIHDYNMMFWQNGQIAQDFRPIDQEQMRTFLTAFANTGEFLTIPEMPIAEHIFVQGAQTAKPEAMVFLERVFPHWIVAQKSSQIMRRGLDGRNAEKAAEQLSQLTDTFKERGKSLKMYGFGHGIDTGELHVERLKTSFMPLDISLGGGFGKGEGVLFIAGQGVGKTVAATQLSTGMALAGHKGVLISTEQTHDQLEPRIVSMRANVPFNNIKDKFDERLLLPDQMERYQQLRKDLNATNYNILDWTSDRERDIFSVMDQLVCEAGEAMGRVDFMYLDWLGSAIGRQFANDPAMLRFIYKNAADAAVQLAVKYNMAVVVFAQAHPEKSYNRVRVDATCLSECKTLGENMTNVIGITGMMPKEADENDGAPLFEDDQWFYISKARKSAGAKAPMRRDFGFQRFALRRA